MSRVFFLFLIVFAVIVIFGFDWALAQTAATGPDFSAINVDLSPVWGLAGTIVGALVTMIVVRKGIKLANRS